MQGKKEKTTELLYLKQNQGRRVNMSLSICLVSMIGATGCETGSIKVGRIPNERTNE